MTWHTLLRAAAVIDGAVLLIVGIALGDVETLALAGLFLVGLIALGRRTGLAGAVILGLLAADTVAWMAPAAASNAAHREEFLDILLPASLAVISVTAAAAAGASVARRGRPTGRAARLLAQAAVAALVVAALAGASRAGGARAPVPGAVGVSIRALDYAPSSLRVGAGAVLRIHNRDLFWHTFTIDALDVDVGVPTGGTRYVSKTSSPGTYEFYCRIPGHRQAGMKGTLVVA